MPVTGWTCSQSLMWGQHVSWSHSTTSFSRSNIYNKTKLPFRMSCPHTSHNRVKGIFSHHHLLVLKQFKPTTDFTSILYNPLGEMLSVKAERPGFLFLFSFRQCRGTQLYSGRVPRKTGFEKKAVYCHKHVMNTLPLDLGEWRCLWLSDFSAVCWNVLD